MRVLIFEGGYLGHRLSYVAQVAAALRTLPVEPVVALPRAALGTPEYRAFIEPLLSEIAVDAWIPAYRGKVAGAAFERCFYLREAIARVRADYVLVPHGDGMVQISGLLAPFHWRIARVPIEALVMRGAFLEQRASLAGRAKALASQLTLTRGEWSTIHLIDFRLWEALVRTEPSKGARLRLMPDPVLPPEPRTKEAARRHLGIPVQGTYLTVAGVIDERKGIEQLLDAMRCAADVRVNLLVAGKQSAAIGNLIDQARTAEPPWGGRIVSIDHFLSPEELEAAIAAADIVATVYPGHVGPASILTRALAANRPVLGSSEGWIGEVIRRLSAGWASPSWDVHALAAALRRAVAEHHEFVLSERAKSFVAYNSPRHFQAAWTRGLRLTLGLPEEPVPEFPLSLSVSPAAAASNHVLRAHGIVR